MTSLRTLALGTFLLSVVGLAGGLAWATVAFLDDGEQSAVGMVLGVLLALPCGVLVLLSGAALALHRRRPGAAHTLLVVAGAGVLVVGLGLLSLFAPARG